MPLDYELWRTWSALYEFHPNYRMNMNPYLRFAESQQLLSLYTANATQFPAFQNLPTIWPDNWAYNCKMQYASIAIDAVKLVMSVLNILPSLSSGAVENATKHVAKVLRNSSKFEKAIKTFVDACNAGDGYQSAKVLFDLMKDAAGLLWTVITALRSNMTWNEWLVTAAKVTATLIAAFATDGAALIAEIALIISKADEFNKKVRKLKAQ